ncbi:MAG: glycosyltransferase [Vulcanimicrobiaceae bacterium]
MFAHIARAFPGAPIYTALYDAKKTGDLVQGHPVHTSWLARVPFANRGFRALAPLYPNAFESFDLRGYDTIVSSTTAWAKGIRVPPDSVHVCYINTVSRFLFAYDQYVGGFGLRTLARPLVKRLAAWDKRASARPTAYIANSQNVARRIREFYGRDAYVLHCPVDLARFTLGAGEGDYFMIASRLLPYKRLDVAIAACQRANVRLLIAGEGPAERALRRRAAGTTTTLLGFVDDAELNRLLGNARAAIVAGEEDFGLVPLEAAATGTPTIAFAAGGALETVLPGRTGEFFAEPTAHALEAVLRGFDRTAYPPSALRAHAETFAPERFMTRLREIVDDVRARQG